MKKAKKIILTSISIGLATSLMACQPAQKTEEKPQVVTEVKKEDNSALKSKIEEIKQLLLKSIEIKDATLKAKYDEKYQALNDYIKLDLSKIENDKLTTLEKEFKEILETALSQNTETQNTEVKQTIAVTTPTKKTTQNKKVVNSKKIPVKPKVKNNTPSKMPVEIDVALTEKIDKTMNEWIAANKIPSGVVLVAKEGKIIAHKAYGYKKAFTKDANSEYENPVYVALENKEATTTDTLFDLASVTKVMATTQSIMKLVSEGKVDLNAPVHRYLPGFEKNGKENVTVKSLLTHTSGLPQWEPTFLYGDTKQQQLEFIKNVSLNPKFLEGAINNQKPYYSDLGFMTLGYIIEAVTKIPLETYVLNNIYKPLGMNNTMYTPLAFGKSNIASTSFGNPYEYKMVDEEKYPKIGYDTTIHAEKFKTFKGWRTGLLTGLVNDGNAGMATKGVSGHAGLFSTAEDLAILTQLMLNKGTYQNVKLYDAKTIDLFTTKQTNAGISNEFGFGFKLDQSWMGDSATEQVFGHDGFTGTYVIADPVNQLQTIVLTNKMQSGFRTSGALTYLYWNIGPMVKEISNSIRTHLNIPELPKN